jgi:hypothetical protein
MRLEITSAHIFEMFDWSIFDVSPASTHRNQIPHLVPLHATFLDIDMERWSASEAEAKGARPVAGAG